MSQQASLRGGTVLGSGLSPLTYGAVLSCSILLFVWWGGPLWATRGHAMRFAVSYLSVVPLASLALAIARRFTWPRLGTAVGTLWAIKLVVTALLYFALAPGGALTEMGAITAARASSTTSSAVPTHPLPVDAPRYQAATEAVPHGTLRGVVTAAGVPVAGVVAVIESPRPGRSLEARERVRIHLDDNGFDVPRHLAFVGQTVDLTNTGQRVHAARVRDDATTLFNAPVPPGGTAQVPHLERAGAFTLQCAVHAGERAELLVLDHPFAATTDAAGVFVIDEVPVGEVSVVLHAKSRIDRRATVRLNEITTITVSVGRE